MRKYFLSHDPKTCRMAVQLYRSGKSIYEVADLIGYGPQAVNTLLRNRNVPRRHGIKPIGSTFMERGRVRIKTENGWEYRYRVKARKIFGNIDGKDIHHKNRNQQDDHPRNLKPMTRSQHCAETNRQRAKRSNV